MDDRNEEWNDIKHLKARVVKLEIQLEEARLENLANLRLQARMSEERRNYPREVIHALVKRLGGSVKLTAAEVALFNRKNSLLISFPEPDGSLRIDAS